jgi:outer membrane lipoprotein-sorting protein
VNLTRLTSHQVTFVVGLLLLSSCASKPQSGSGSPQTNEQIVSSTPPFQTKEPERYKAVRTFTFIDPSGASTTQKVTIARFEMLRREDTQTTDSGNVVFIESDKGRFVLLPDARIYSEVTETSAIDPTEFESSPERLLHPEALSTSYQKIGPELLTERKTTKYRITVNSGTEANVSAIETLIWVDETLGMPIKSETTGKDGSRVVMELSNIVLEVDKNVFRVPDGYAKVSAAELRKRLHQKQED